MKKLIFMVGFLISFILIQPVLAQKIKMSEDGYSVTVLSATNQIHWQYHFNTLTFSPSQDKNALYFGNKNGEIIKLDRLNGQLIWRKKISNGWVYSPALSQNLLITGGQDSMLYALNKINQQLVWKKALAQQLVYQVVSDKNFIITTTFDGKVQAFNAQNGQLKWQQQFSSASQFPLFYKDLIILASYEGQLRFLSRQDGTLKRQENIQTLLLESPKITHQKLQLVNNNQQKYTFEL